MQHKEHVTTVFAVITIGRLTTATHKECKVKLKSISSVKYEPNESQENYKILLYLKQRLPLLFPEESFEIYSKIISLSKIIIIFFKS